jgi:4-amino-4-deoxy-L-arabinose transferase-like glycosyltransferase
MSSKPLSLPTSAPSGRVLDARYSWRLAGILAALTLYRLAMLTVSELELYFDEAYYFGWAKTPAFGYFSKPPMVAWIIGLTTSVCGDGEVCIRSGALLLFPATAWTLYLTGRRLFDGRTGFFTALAFATLPLVSLYSWFMTTDAPLLLFWALSLYFLSRALDSDAWKDWLATGLCLGLGLLSKYTMLVFAVSALIYLMTSPIQRRHLKNPKTLSAFFTAAVIFLPNLWWNYTHGFASFKHTAEISQLDRALFHPDRMAGFLTGQFLVFGPIMMAAFIACLTRVRRITEHERLRFLLSFSLPLLLLYSVQSLLARAHLNWAAAAYVPATALVVAWLLEQEKTRILAWAITVNLLLGVTLYHYPAIIRLSGMELSRSTDPFTWMKGWRALGAEMQTILRQHPDTGLLSDDRRTLAEVIYYIRPQSVDAAIWNPGGRVSDHYRLTADIKDSLHKDFIFVTQNTPDRALLSRFGETSELARIDIPLYAGHGRHYRVYRLRDFKGYSRRWGS